MLRQRWNLIIIACFWFASVSAFPSQEFVLLPELGSSFGGNEGSISAVQFSNSPNQHSRVKRGLFPATPEYQYFKLAFSAIDAREGKSKYEATFTKTVQNTMTKEGRNYKGQIAWNSVLPGVNSYTGAIGWVRQNLNNAYRNGNGNSKSKAVTAVRKIPDIVTARRNQMNRYSDADAGHDFALKTWNAEWDFWYNSYGTAVIRKRT